MNWVHRLIDRFAPPSVAASMEVHSRQWQVRCLPCGYERSLWDIGGVRWKGSGTSYTWGRCPRCGKRGWHKIYRPKIPTSLAKR